MNSLIERQVVDKSMKPIDREKNCPLLLRVFLSNQRHHQPSEFAKGQVPANELQIYTWTDATLKELTNLVKEVHEDSRKKGTIFDFALIYPEQNSNVSRMRIEPIGSTMCGINGPDDNKSLQSLKFQIGDFLDISITSPQNNAPIRDRIDRGPIRRDRVNARY